MSKYLFATVAALLLATSPQQARADSNKLTVIVFPGVQNLPMFASQAKGFYAKRGLDVEIKFTPNSDELRNGLAEGRYQIAHSAVDNAFALKDKANVDIAVVLGGDNSLNRLFVQPRSSRLPISKARPLPSTPSTRLTHSSFTRCCARRGSTKATTRSSQSAERGLA